MSRTITKLFDNYSDAKSAVAALEQLGVPNSDISIVASNADGAHGDHDAGDLGSGPVNSVAFGLIG